MIILKLMELLDQRTKYNLSGNLEEAKKVESELKRIYKENRDELVEFCPDIENETDEVKAVSTAINKIARASK